jgi:hypothetical protein
VVAPYLGLRVSHQMRTGREIVREPVGAGRAL